MSWSWNHAEFTCDHSSRQKRSAPPGPPYPPPPPHMEKEYSRKKRKKDRMTSVNQEHDDEERSPRSYETPEYESEPPKHEAPKYETKDEQHECHDDCPPPCCEEGPPPCAWELEECRRKHDKLALKAMVVVAEECFQKFGTLEINAPPGITVDPETGKILQQLHLEPVGPPVFKPVVLADKLVNEGFLHAKLVIDSDNPTMTCNNKVVTSSIQVVIPLQSIHDIEGICPGDHVQESAEIEGLLISAAQNVCNPNGNLVRLTLKAILKAHVVVTRECIVCVTGKTLHCLKKD